MARYPIVAAALFFVLPTAPALASGPSFDCAKATRQIDKAICAWDTVGSLDGEMAAAYRAALTVQPDEGERTLVEQDQQRWLAARDAQCALDAVKPDPGSEEGLSPQEFGQLLCLQDMYGSQIAHLEDMVPPLVPVSVVTLPTDPLRAAYPADDQPSGYQALFSPDKALMALGVEDSAGYVRQVWLYQPASGQLVVASPQTDKGKAENPEHISELNSWVFGEDGRFYLRARRPLGQDGMFGADMTGYSEIRDPPSDVAEKIAAADAVSNAVFYDGKAPEGETPPGFDDDSYDEQEGGAFTAWAQNKGHGSFDLLAARAGDEEPRLIASGGWELRDFLFDPSGTRLFYNGEEGLVVTDPATSITHRLKGTHGKSPENKPINMSADGEILVYAATGSCTRDAGEDGDQDTGKDDGSKRICLATLPPVSEPASKPVADTVSTKPETVPAGDPWVGRWEGSGEGNLSATIRRGTAKPDYLVIELVTGVPGCSGAVTLYGKPKGSTVFGESYDPNEPTAPVCRVELSLDKGTLKTEVAGPCTFYHGAACGFDGNLTRGE
ncbi:MAG: lysozyme inhibitor LprI family protein [Mesorhizobium sp.]